MLLTVTRSKIISVVMSYIGVNLKKRLSPFSGVSPLSHTSSVLLAARFSGQWERTGNTVPHMNPGIGWECISQEVP